MNIAYKKWKNNNLKKNIYYRGKILQQNLLCPSKIFKWMVMRKIRSHRGVNRLTENVTLWEAFEMLPGLVE